jgi:hypothetical protein
MAGLHLLDHESCLRFFELHLWGTGNLLYG